VVERDAEIPACRESVRGPASPPPAAIHGIARAATPTALSSRDPWVRLIASFKLAKGTFLLAAAVAALGLMSPRTAQPISRWAMELAADRHYEVATTVAARLLSVEPRTLRLISAGSFLYAILFYTEGFGLFLDKRWAKYMTILSTAALVPFEAFEVVHRGSSLKIGILVANVAIVAYLAARVRGDEAGAERRA
jgi:uncharacterized membrane protein (DUF2068 family)